jgi:hypothetical protein
MQIRPIDVARAAATTLSAGPGLPIARRLMRTTSVALEVLAHLRGDWSGRRLRTVGLDGLDATARAETVQRIGVGLARIVAERGPLKLVDFYNLDALASDPSAPVVVRRQPRRRRRPDLAGSDVMGAWSLLEAKGRTASGELRNVRLSALDQVRSVDLAERNGEPIEPVARVSCVARLGDGDVTVFADDPPSGEQTALYRIDTSELVYHYYTLAREVLALVGRTGPGLSGAPDYAALPLIGDEQLILGVHRRVLEVLDDPDGLLAVRAEVRESYEAEQAEAEEAQDLTLGIGPDGFALASRALPMQSALEPRPEDDQ